MPYQPACWAKSLMVSTSDSVRPMVMIRFLPAWVQWWINHCGMLGVEMAYTSAPGLALWAAMASSGLAVRKTVCRLLPAALGSPLMVKSAASWMRREVTRLRGHPQNPDRSGTGCAGKWLTNPFVRLPGVSCKARSARFSHDELDCPGVGHKEIVL